MAVAGQQYRDLHNAQQLQVVDVETQPGVRCQQLTRPIASVGEIPGGWPLLTVLMLATPARIAGCQEVWCCVRRRRLPMKFFMRRSCAGVRNIFNVGGAYIAAMAFGTESWRSR